MCDLAGDMSPLLELDSDTLRERLYTRRDKLQAQESAIPIKLVHINKCPVLAPAKTLLPENADRLGIDRQRCLQNLQLLRQNPQVREKWSRCLHKLSHSRLPMMWIHSCITAFFSDADRATIKIIQQTESQNLPALDLTFQDPRLEALLFRFRARNYPNTLNDSEQQRWLQHRREALSPERVQDYVLQLEQFYNQYEDDKEKLALLKALFEYAKGLVS